MDLLKMRHETSATTATTTTKTRTTTTTIKTITITTTNDNDTTTTMTTQRRRRTEPNYVALQSAVSITRAYAMGVGNTTTTKDNKDNEEYSATNWLGSS